MAAKRSSGDANSVKPLRRRVFESLSRRIHDASFELGSEPGLSDVEVLANYLAALLTTQRRESGSIERRYSVLPRKWYRIVTS